MVASSLSAPNRTHQAAEGCGEWNDGHWEE